MSKGPLTARERELTAQLEEAEERIRQICDLRAGDPMRVYRHITFTPTDAALIKCLSTSPGRPIGAEKIRLSLDAARLRLGDCPGTSASVYVAVYRLRVKLKRAMADHDLPPMTIHTVFGQGFAISASSIANLRALMIEDTV